MPATPKRSTTAKTAAQKGAKTPTDRKPAASTVAAQTAGDEITVEVDGHEYTITQDALDDFELLDDLSELEKGNGARLPSVLKRLVGPDGFREAMEQLRDKETGRVTVERGGEFVQTLLEAANPNS